MISMLRVDDRLVHGMVAVSWTSQLRPDVIVVANDRAAKDSFFSMTLKLAKPAGVDLYIWTCEEASKKLVHPKLAPKNVFLVTGNTEDALYMCENVDNIPAVNIGIGGLSKTDEMIPVLPEIYMGPKDYECTRKISEKDIEVFAQLIPSKPKVSFQEITKMFNK